MKGLSRGGFIAGAMWLAACSSAPEAEAPTGVTEPILTPPPQRSAAGYSAAVAISVNNADGDFCSGVLVSPRVVLTASHCVSFNPDDDGAGPHGTWTVTIPYAAGGSQTRTASSGEPYNPTFYSLSVTNYDSTDSALHDLALVYLDTAATGVTFPTFSATQYPITANTQVSAVGRSSPTASAGLALSKAVTLAGPSAGDFYLNDNHTPRVTDGGDSGGPLYLEGTNTLVGTETRFDPSANLDYWARLDGVVYTFIQSAIAAHGGTVNDSVVDFEDQVAAALCGRAAACCIASNGSAYYQSPTKCRDVYAKSGFEGTARDLLAANHGNVSISATGRASCLAAIGNTTLCNITSAAMKANIGTCIGAVTGKLGQGAACTSSVECAGSAACELAADGTGTCQPTHGSGTSCEVLYKGGSVDARYDLAQDLCSKRGGGDTARYCDGYDFAGNAYRDETTWTCKAAKAAGASCGTNAECQSLVCAPFGAASQFTCVTQTPFTSASVCSLFQ